MRTACGDDTFQNVNQRNVNVYRMGSSCLERYCYVFTSRHGAGLFCRRVSETVNLNHTEFISVSIDKNYFAWLSIIYNFQSSKIAQRQ